MSDQKFIRIALAVVIIILLGFVFTLTFNRPTTTSASAVTPPPRTPVAAETSTPVNPGNGNGDNNHSDDDDDDDDPVSSISGLVIDLATGRPAAGVPVEINGEVVTTDGRGHYSRTGLAEGTYELKLQLPDNYYASQTTWHVMVGQNQAVSLDLSFSTQPPAVPDEALAQVQPTATPTPAVVVEPPPPPTATPTPRRQQANPLIFSPSGNAPVLWISPGYINNEEGVAGFITIDVMNVMDFGAFQATLEYDPRIIEIDNVVLGDFLDSTGRQTTPLVTEIDNTSGQVSFVAFTSGESAGPDGGGTLAVVNFFSKQAGVSDLILDEVRLVSRLGEPITAEVGSGMINVSACFGDLNSDKIIDIGDLQIVAGRIGQQLGDLNYESQFDVNSDGIIDENDVTLITDRLYETCP